MGYNAKLAVHYVQLRITLTRLTSDYREGSHCSTEPVVYSLVVSDSGYSGGIYLSIHSAVPYNATIDSTDTMVRRATVILTLLSHFFIT